MAEKTRLWRLNKLAMVCLLFLTVGCVITPTHIQVQDPLPPEPKPVQVARSAIPVDVIVKMGDRPIASATVLLYWKGTGAGSLTNDGGLARLMCYPDWVGKGVLEVKGEGLQIFRQEITLDGKPKIGKESVYVQMSQKGK